MKLELFKPIKPFLISQAFGKNSLPLYFSLGMLGHNGLDLVAGHGQEVRAAHDGIVTFAGEDGSAGWGVVLRTENEREYGNATAFFKTIYWHLLPAIPVKAGQKIKCGQVIGFADNTGLSTGDHLHFGLKPVFQGEQDWQWGNVEQLNGYFGAVDPLPYLSKMYAEDFRSIQDKITELITKVANLLFLWRK